MIRDLYSEIKITQVVAPAVITEDTDGTGVDTLGYDSGPVFIANIGTTGETLSGSLKIELEVEESDDDVTYTDVADADLKNFVAGTNDGCFAVIDDNAEDVTVYICEYRGSQRYARAVVNIVGTHNTGTPIGIVAVQGNAHLKPVNT